MKIKNLILLALAVLSFIPLQAQTTIFQFTFENTELVTVENAVGTPTFSAVGVNTASYFGGATISDCPTPTGNSRSYAGWNTGDYYQFTVNTTGYSTLTFSYCSRTSNITVGNFSCRVSSDLSNWTTIVSSYTPGTSFQGYSGTLPPAFDNKTTVYIQLYKDNDPGDSGNNCRIDNATLTGSVADINLQTPVGTNVACGTGTAAFGSVNVGSSSTQTIRIQNVGTGPLNLTSLPLTITGTNANQFSIITQPTSPIAAGSFSDLVVQFSPTSNGAKTASISIASNDPDENPCSISLSGTGVSPDINLQTPVGTNVACGTGTAAFGSINIGSSTTKTIRIQNLGTSALNLTGLPLSITGLNADQFSIVTQPTSPIAAGSFSDMVVQFSPTSNGAKTASISIASNDPDENPCSINLSGTGVSPDINLQTPVGTNVACGTGAASFGNVNVGSSTTKTIRIQNLGTSALNLTGLPLSITGTNADQFSIVTQPTSPIAAGAFSDMVVQFSPTSSGAKTATISIANNDPDENPCSIDLNGTGVALVPDINLQSPVSTNLTCGAGTVAFGSVNIGNSTTKTIRIQNLGTGPLNLSNLPFVITGLNADQFSITTQPTTPIAAGAFVDMVVQFTPTNSGVQTATISIGSDDPDENPCSIDLNGTGVALVPDINLQSPVGTNVTCGAGTVAFGSVNIGNSTTKTIRIQNLGTGPLNLSNLPLVITGTNADQFSIVTQPTTPIAAGAFVDMVVQFTPTNSGTQTATISIASDDPDENPCTIDLDGTGVALVPDINLQSPVGTNVTCGAGTVAFGSVNIGNSTNKTIRIQNLGTGPLNLSNFPLVITGLNADQFSIVTQPTSSIAAGAFSDMVVQFAPTNSGTQTATISIASDDPDENPCSIDLNGTGVALVPDISLQTPIGTNVTCGAGTILFGSVNIGNSLTKTIRIQNLGTGSLNLSNLPLVIIGTNADQFSIITQPSSPIAAGSFSDIVVQFTPTNSGTQTATISIASDDPDENPCSIDLNGTGVALVPDISLQTPVGTNVACGAGTVNFGTIGIGSTGTATARIANVGTAPLNLANLPLSITGANADQFTILTQPTSPIASGAFSDIILQFSPTSAGVKTASISIGSDDPDENPCTINLSGTGLLQALYFRSKISGNWTDASTWETSPNNSTWSNAVIAPVNYASDLTVTIQSSHIVSILDDITVDQVVISAGGTLSTNNITLLTINNGSGVDFDVQGTFEDGASAAKTAVFASGATWQLGSSGTFLKTSDADMVNYRTNYQGGISNIPASAFWIIRLSSDLNIANPGMYFPNLSLESVSGTVNYNMTGASATYTVKGNLEVGVTGAGTVNLNNENTYSAAFQVLGNCTIGNRSKITNFSGIGNTYGNGFDLYGNLTMVGDVELNYGNGTSKGVLSFKGGNAQQVTGDGLMFVNNLVVNKSGASVNFTAVSTPPIVFEQINLINKNMVLNEVNLWLDKNCQVVNASNSSYVQTNGFGTVFRETTSTHPFPIGFSSYNPITITGTGALDYFHARIVDEVLEDGTSGAPFTTNVVDRTWFVTEETQGGNTMNLTMTWYSSDELSGFSRNACYTSHYDGTNWVGTTPAAASGTGTGPFTRTRTGQTTFSLFAIGSNGALPIKLLRFTALLQHKQVNLSWQTATEEDNALFLLEHSTDGIQFTQIGSVPGAGNSQTILSYQFWDNKPTPGTNYYRLKQVDYNGQFTYSPVVTVQLDGPGGFHLFPVPVKDHLQLQLDESEAFESQWAVYNALGQLVLSGILPEDQSILDLDVSDLAPGMYWFQRVSDRARSSRMFVKE